MRVRPPLRAPFRFSAMKTPHPSASRFQQLFLLLHLLACVGLWLTVGLQARPQALPDLHLAEGEKLACVSYAPYHLPGQTPLDPDTRISREQIASDLAALAPLTRCIRIYAVNQGLELVPEIAAQLGLKVLLGAWIGHDPALNRQELETAIQLANRHPKVIRGLIVGNEVLLRREQPEAALKALLDEARSRVQVPVTYADVWEFWLRHPSLADSVDFITVHILPYWEDEPVAVDQAVSHVGQVRQQLLEHYGKPVLIGETGWPSQGRQREAARPGKVEQARYIRSFVHEAHRRDWDYNLIEAIDQPWKRHLEGTVGGCWGILDTDLHANFPFQGPVAQRDSLTALVLASAGGLMLFGLLALIRKRPRQDLVAAAIAGVWTGSASWLAWEHGLVAYRNSWEWSVLGGIALAGGLLALAHAAGARARQPFMMADATIQARILPGLRSGILFAAATASLLLLADPRYRDFPYWLYLLPLPTLAALAWSGTVQTGREEGILAVVIMLCGLGRWLMEPGNPEAQAWAMLCLLLGLTGLVRISKASKAAGAEASKQ